MSQAPVILPGSPLTGASAAADMNAAWAAMISKFSGSSSPTLGPGASGALVEGQDWLNTSTAGTISAPHDPYQWNGTIWVPKATKTKLTADTTYFFNSSLGNDANSGLSSGAGAFQTFGVVNALVNSIDTNGHNLILSLAAGTWSNFSLTVPVIGGGTVILDGGSAATTTLTTTSAAAAVACYTTGGGALDQSAFAIKNMTLTATGGGDCLDISCGNAAIAGTVTFGAVSGGGGHIRVDGNQSRLFCQSNYNITGGAAWHLASVGLGLVDYNNGGITVTLTGTMTFTTAFAFATIMSCIVSLVTWTGGTITATRFVVNDNSVIYTNGAGATYFPGNVNGTAPGANGGQYV